MEYSFDEVFAKFSKSASLSKNTCEDLYSIGYHYYKNGKYREATGCFSLLVIANSHSAKYWNSFGASQMMIGNYQEALTSFAFASEIDALNPQHSFNAAECFFALQRKEEGLRALADAEKLAKAKDENEELLSRIKALRITQDNK